MTTASPQAPELAVQTWFNTDRPLHLSALRGRVSGLCQPDFVVDIPGGHGKAPAGPNYLSVEKSFSADREQAGETRYRIVDYCGDVHLYPPVP